MHPMSYCLGIQILLIISSPVQMSPQQKRLYCLLQPGIPLSCFEPKSILSESLLRCLRYSLSCYLFTPMPYLLQICAQCTRPIHLYKMPCPETMFNN